MPFFKSDTRSSKKIIKNNCTAHVKKVRRARVQPCAVKNSIISAAVNPTFPSAAAKTPMTAAPHEPKAVVTTPAASIETKESKAPPSHPTQRPVDAGVRPPGGVCLGAHLSDEDLLWFANIFSDNEDP